MQKRIITHLQHFFFKGTFFFINIKGGGAKKAGF